MQSPQREILLAIPAMIVLTALVIAAFFLIRAAQKDQNHKSEDVPGRA